MRERRFSSREDSVVWPCLLSLESQDGTKIVTDPFDGSVAYKIPMVEADIVTVSHDHYDHNYVEGVQVIRDYETGRLYYRRYKYKVYQLS